MNEPTRNLPLADFGSRLSEHLDELEATGQPTVLTEAGRARAVLISPEMYHRLVQEAEDAFDNAMIAMGEADIKAGRVYDAREAVRQLALRHGHELPE
jgi:prevent-host-death family protein